MPNRFLDFLPEDEYARVMQRPVYRPRVSRAPAHLAPLFEEVASRYGLDPDLLERMAQQESGFNPGAQSPAGAQGLMQLMPSTAQGLGVQDPWDAAQNLDGGARYLKQMLDRYGGDQTLALMAYNAGPGTVDRYGANVPYEETQRYVRNILGGQQAPPPMPETPPFDFAPPPGYMPELPSSSYTPGPLPQAPVYAPPPEEEPVPYPPFNLFGYPVGRRQPPQAPMPSLQDAWQAMQGYGFEAPTPEAPLGSIPGLGPIQGPMQPTEGPIWTPPTPEPLSIPGLGGVPFDTSGPLLPGAPPVRQALPVIPPEAMQWVEEERNAWPPPPPPRRRPEDIARDQIRAEYPPLHENVLQGLASAEEAEKARALGGPTPVESLMTPDVAWRGFLASLASPEARQSMQTEGLAGPERAWEQWQPLPSVSLAGRDVDLSDVAKLGIEMANPLYLLGGEGLPYQGTTKALTGLARRGAPAVRAGVQSLGPDVLRGMERLKVMRSLIQTPEDEARFAALTERYAQIQEGLETAHERYQNAAMAVEWGTADTGIVRPANKFVGWTDQEVLDFAQREGRNPHQPDWADSLDPVALKDARTSRRGGSKAKEAAAGRSEMQDAQAEMDALTAQQKALEQEMDVLTGPLAYPSVRPANMTPELPTRPPMEAPKELWQMSYEEALSAPVVQVDPELPAPLRKLVQQTAPGEPGYAPSVETKMHPQEARRLRDQLQRWYWYAQGQKPAGYHAPASSDARETVKRLGENPLPVRTVDNDARSSVRQEFWVTASSGDVNVRFYKDGTVGVRFDRTRQWQEGLEDALAAGNELPADVAAGLAPDDIAQARARGGVRLPQRVSKSPVEPPALTFGTQTETPMAPKPAQGALFAPGEAPVAFPQKGKAGGTADILGMPQFPDEAARLRWEREQQRAAGQQELVPPPESTIQTSSPPSPVAGPAAAGTPVPAAGTGGAGGVPPIEPPAATVPPAQPPPRRQGGATAQTEADRLQSRAKGATGPGQGGPYVEKPDYAANIQLAKFPEDARPLIEGWVDAHPDAVQAARRGVRPDAQVLEDARALVNDNGGQWERLVKNWRPGQAWNAEEIVAVRGALNDATGRVVAAQRAFQQGGDSTENLLKLQLALKEHQAVQEIVHGVTAEAGRGLRQFRQDAQTALQNADVAKMQRLLKLAGGRENAERVATLLGQIDLDNPSQVAAFVREFNRPKVSDYITEYFYNSILSGPPTHVANFVSNTITTFSSPVERLAAAAVEIPLAGLQGRPRDRFVGEAMADALGIVRGLPEGVRAALYTLRYGASPEALAKFEMRPQAFPGKPGAVINAPSRILETGDQFWRAVIYRGALNASAYRLAAKEKRTGTALARRVAELVGNPTDAMIEESAQQAEYRLFRNDPGDLANRIMQVRNLEPSVSLGGKEIGVQPLRLFFPFVRTPTNLLKFGLERSPLGFFNPRLWEAIGTKSPEASEKLSRALGGSVLAAALYSYAEQGNITGDAPVGAGERDRFYREGKQPYSLKIGDKWFSYQRWEPMNQTLSQVAAVVNAKNSKESWTEAAGTAVKTIAKNFGSQSYMDSIRSVMDAFEDPDRYGNQLVQHFATSWAPFSAAQRSVARTLDPTVRTARDVPSAIAGNTPGLSQTVPPKLNVFGEETQRESPALSPYSYKTASTDPLEGELERLKANIGPAPKLIVLAKGQEPTKLTPAQYDALQRTQGPLIKTALASLVAQPFYTAADDAEKKTALAAVADKLRGLAQADFKATLQGKASRLKNLREDAAEFPVAYGLKAEYDAIPSKRGMTAEEDKAARAIDAYYRDVAKQANGNTARAAQMTKERFGAGAIATRNRWLTRGSNKDARERFWRQNRGLLDKYFNGQAGADLAEMRRAQ